MACLWPGSLKLPGLQWSVRSPNCCDISLKMSKDFYQTQQPSALSIHFYHHCLEGTLGFPKIYILSSSGILCFHLAAMAPASVHPLSAIWGQNCPPQNARWMVRREVTVEQTTCITEHSQLRRVRRAHVPHWEQVEICAVGAASLWRLLWSSTHRENVLTITKMSVKWDM